MAKLDILKFYEKSLARYGIDPRTIDTLKVVGARGRRRRFILGWNGNIRFRIDIPRNGD